MGELIPFPTITVDIDWCRGCGDRLIEPDYWLVKLPPENWLVSTESRHEQIPLCEECYGLSIRSGILVPDK